MVKFWGMNTTALVTTLHLLGLDAHPVQIEAMATRGNGAFTLLGLADTSTRESRIRVRAALQQIGVVLGGHDVTVSLSPNEPKKSGGAFDLAIAAAVLIVLGKMPAASMAGTVLLGELSLTGAVRPVRGVLPMLRAASRFGFTRAITSRDNSGEASVGGIEAGVIDTLHDLVLHATTGAPLQGAGIPQGYVPSFGHAAGADLADVRGQVVGRRAIEIAAAGGHNLLLLGPAGAGKTMLGRRLPTLLPGMTVEEAREVTAIFSVTGLLQPGHGLVTARPFRAPHHTVSAAGLVGGGDPVRPGEVSLAHHGVLFLDEINEFKGGVLESMRQPIEDGEVTVCRSRTRHTFPARAILVGGANLCPCGYDKGSGRCGCAPERVAAYRKRLAGPIFDRMDLQVEIAPVSPAHLQTRTPGESSAVVRNRVVAARAIQTARAARLGCPQTNGALTSKGLEQVVALDDAGQRLLANAVERLGLPTRAYGAVLRMARTIADLDGSAAVQAPHVAEAVGMRMLDRTRG